MANEGSVIRPSRPHFMKPILPGFEHQLPIPVAFFKYLNGQDCKRAVLRGRGGKLWQVKIVDGSFLGDGWGEFVRDHDLHVGDILVFAHEGDMVFDVVVFDISTCVREYPDGDVFKDVKVEQEEEDDPDEELALVHCPGESSKEKEITDHKNGKELTSQVCRESSKEKEFTNHKNRKELTSQVCDLTDHKQTVAASKGKHSSSVLDKKLLLINITPGCNGYVKELPMKFTRLNHLREKPGNVDLIDQQGRSFTVRLVCKKSSDKVYFGSGWKDFCLANGLEEGHTITFELIEKRKKMTFIMCRLQPKHGAKKKLDRPVVQIASSPIKPPHFTIALKAWHVRNCLNIPMDFAVRNGLAYRGCKMILKNGKGRSWEVQLTNDTRPASIGYGWTKFARENELKSGDVVKFKLLRGGRWPVMKFKGTTLRKESTTAAE